VSVPPDMARDKEFVVPEEEAARVQGEVLRDRVSGKTGRQPQSGYVADLD
jgi:hypothetical protein